MIYDLSNQRIFSGKIVTMSEGVKILRIRVDCQAGYGLSAAAPGVEVLARKTGETIWTDIEVSPLFLTSWDGTRQEFEVQVTAPTVTAREQHSIDIRVRPEA